MRYGILSDIHANIEALETVLKAYESEAIDKYICLGDTVGYGASPNEACSLMRSKVAQAVLGNHDAAVAGRMDYSYYYYAARQALDKHAQLLEAAGNGQEFRNAWHVVVKRRIETCHLRQVWKPVGKCFN